MRKFKVGDKVLYSLDSRRRVHEVKGVYPTSPTEYWIRRIGTKDGTAEGRVEEKNLSPATTLEWDEEAV